MYMYTKHDNDGGRISSFPHIPLQHTLQHTATHCNTLQHIAAHCDTLRHTATHFNTLERPHVVLMYIQGSAKYTGGIPGFQTVCPWELQLVPGHNMVLMMNPMRILLRPVPNTGKVFRQVFRQLKILRRLICNWRMYVYTGQCKIWRRYPRISNVARWHL